MYYIRHAVTKMFFGGWEWGNPVWVHDSQEALAYHSPGRAMEDFDRLEGTISLIKEEFVEMRAK